MNYDAVRQAQEGQQALRQRRTRDLAFDIGNINTANADPMSKLRAVQRRQQRAVYDQQLDDQGTADTIGAATANPGAVGVGMTNVANTTPTQVGLPVHQDTGADLGQDTRYNPGPLDTSAFDQQQQAIRDDMDQQAEKARDYNLQRLRNANSVAGERTERDGTRVPWAYERPLTSAEIASVGPSRITPPVHTFDSPYNYQPPAPRRRSRRQSPAAFDLTG